MSFLVLLLTSAFVCATPLICAALGGLYSEKSGIVNIGLEGMMAFGAYTGTIFLIYVTSSTNGILGSQILLAPNILVYLLTVIIAALGGALWGYIHGLLTIKCKLDQVISGTVINIVTLAIALSFISATMGTEETKTIPSVLNTKFTIMIGSEPLYIHYITIIVFLLIIFTHYVFKYTKFGKKITAVGENPHAADAMGINVLKTKYIAVIISGALAGIAGMSIVFMITSKFSATTIAGKGFIALAVLIFGRYSTKGILLAGGFFGLMQSLSIIMPVAFTNIKIDSTVYEVVPYIVTIIALIFTAKKNYSPKSLGKVYDKETR
jgi:simple sugar transport system permease protein